MFHEACCTKLPAAHGNVRLSAGTQISDIILDLATAGLQTVKGFATIDNVALINVEVQCLGLASFTQHVCHLDCTPDNFGQCHQQAGTDLHDMLAYTGFELLAVMLNWSIHVLPGLSDTSWFLNW